MKRKIGCLLVMAAAAFMAGAEEMYYLYWMVDTESADQSFEYSSVKVKEVSSATGKGDYLQIYYGDVGDSVSADMIRAAAAGNNAYFAGPVSAGDYSYLVELWLDQSAVAQSGKLTSEDALQYLYNPSAGLPITGRWVAGDFTAMPEPSSAMLMLFGLAGLALRRKAGACRGPRP